jgi:hypothetical protein
MTAAQTSTYETHSQTIAEAGCTSGNDNDRKYRLLNIVEGDQELSTIACGMGMTPMSCRCTSGGGLKRNRAPGCGDY